MKEKTLPKNELIHDFDGKKPRNSIDKSVKSKKSNPLVLVVIFTLILGIGTGFLAAQTSGSIGGSGKGPLSVNESEDSGDIKKGATFGVEDTEQFPDDAEGIVREGGVEGEGAYHLERPGGESQNVYMTSSILDLSQFVGRKVKVWGATYGAETAGWFMDVGFVEIL